MNFRVSRPFKWHGNVRMPGQIIAMDVGEASKFRAMGLIGQTEQAVAPPTEHTVAPEQERAVKKPAERRSRKAKKEQEAENDVADLGNPSGD